MNWLLEHGTEIIGIVSAVLSVASMITGLTTTDADDKFVKKLTDWLSFLTPKNAPGTFKMPFKKVKK